MPRELQSLERGPSDTLAGANADRFDGAGAHGHASLETAVRLADQASAESLRVETRLVLAEALIHSWGGLDEEGLAALTEAERIALATGDHEATALARAELGYVDFLRARYDRAERRLGQVAQGSESPSTLAKAMTYLGSVASDRAEYPRAISLLQQATRLSRNALEPRREAFGLSMLGRIGLLRGDLVDAARLLRAAIDLAERDHWLSFIPWPQALLGQVLLPGGSPPPRTPSSSRSPEPARSATRAGRASRPAGSRSVTEASGDVGRAFTVLLDARSRSTRLADPYRWLDVHILNALCELGRRHGHAQTRRWVDDMRDGASRTAMRELTVRAMLHNAALGDRGTPRPPRCSPSTSTTPSWVPWSQRPSGSATGLADLRPTAVRRQVGQGGAEQPASHVPSVSDGFDAAVDHVHTKSPTRLLQVEVG